jgi:hypothetical protein
MPLPQLRYAQVVKQYRRRRLIRVHHRVAFGSLAAVQQVLASHSWQINTAFIEHVNLTIRHHVAAVGRRVMTLCKGEEGVRHQLALYSFADTKTMAHRRRFISRVLQATTDAACSEPYAAVALLPWSHPRDSHVHG